MTMRIEITNDRQWHLPGEEVSGRVVWSLDTPPEAVEMRLFWHTSGKGTQDVEIVWDLRIDDPATSGERSFSFALPLGPYSFSGSLITLEWALEFVALPSGETERVRLIVAPVPAELRLESLGREPAGHSFQIGPSKK